MAIHPVLLSCVTLEIYLIPFRIQAEKKKKGKFIGFPQETKNYCMCPEHWNILKANGMAFVKASIRDLCHLFKMWTFVLFCMCVCVYICRQ